MKFVPPHASEHGFLFYDLEYDGATLRGRKIYVPKVRITRSPDPKRVGTDLLFFEIDLKPALVGP